MLIVPSLLAALGLASVHLFSRLLRVLDGIPRSRFLSVASGIAVTYVFLRLLPGLSESQGVLEAALREGPFSFLRHPVYLVALVSLVTFYSLERLARRSRAEGEVGRTSMQVFWLSIGVFAVVNVLIGYLLLHGRQQGLRGLLLFFIAMLLKFVVNDHGLHYLHREAYDQVGRWLLAGAVLLGWGIGYLTELPPLGLALLQSALAGAIILNVLKEELPEERRGRISAFVLGAAAYGALLLAL